MKLTRSIHDFELIKFPEGYSVREMYVSEVSDWTSIVRQSEKLIYIEPNKFEQEFFGPMNDGSVKCFIVENDLHRQKVGTFSVIGNQIHWLYVVPEHQKKGIGKAAISFLIRTIITGRFESCFLITQDNRVDAISFYNKLGFVPEHEL